MLSNFIFSFLIIFTELHKEAFYFFNLINCIVSFIPFLKIHFGSYYDLLWNTNLVTVLFLAQNNNKLTILCWWWLHCYLFSSGGLFILSFPCCSQSFDSSEGFFLLWKSKNLSIALKTETTIINKGICS